LAEAQNHLKTLQALGVEEQNRGLTLEQENQQLRATEAELQKLKGFGHYLKLVPKLAEYA